MAKIFHLKSTVSELCWQKGFLGVFGASDTSFFSYIVFTEFSTVLYINDYKITMCLELFLLRIKVYFGFWVSPRVHLLEATFTSCGILGSGRTFMRCNLVERSKTFMKGISKGTLVIWPLPVSILILVYRKIKRPPMSHAPSTMCYNKTTPKQQHQVTTDKNCWNHGQFFFFLSFYGAVNSGISKLK